jgi:DNA polymerase III delta prime subunit
MTDIPLHPTTASQLEQMLKSPAHAYLFTGPPFSYKRRAAEQLAAQLACVPALPSPNVLILQPEDLGSIKIAQVKSVLSWLSRTAHNPSAHRVVIIASAHTMTADAQGALLKMLEEPADKVVFILVADSVEGILATIQSRTQRILFRPLLLSDDGMEPRHWEQVERSAEEREAHSIVNEYAERFIDGTTTDRFLVAKLAHEQQLSSRVVEQAERKLRNQLLDQPDAHSMLRKLIACEGYVKSRVNARLCLEHLAMEFAR